MKDLRIVFTDDLGNERTIFAKDIENLPLISMTPVSETGWKIIDIEGYSKKNIFDKIRNIEGFENAISISIDINPHKTCYETVEEYFQAGFREDDLDDISAKDYKRMVETDKFVQVNLYILPNCSSVTYLPLD